MRLLLTGASGQLGAYLLRELQRRGIPTCAWSGAHAGLLSGTEILPVDLTEPDQLTKAFRTARPTVVIHAAALASVAECFRNPGRARLVNVAGTELLAELTAAHSAKLLFVSTDLVFAGTKAPYRENDPPTPLSVYGRSKADAEKAVLVNGNGAVVRVSLLYGPSLNGRASFFDQQVNALRVSRPVTLFEDEWRTPLDLPTAARALVDIACSDFSGLLHVGGPVRLTRVEMGERLARQLGVDAANVVVCRRDSVPAPEPRPRDTSLDAGKWRELFPEESWPTMEQALSEMCRVEKAHE
jgi:dTDP-4-dehydrorhamnose reductase